MAILFDDAKHLTSYNASTHRSWSIVIPFVNKLIETSDESKQNWITYPGSLPVPPHFYESVTWIIRDNTFTISSKQVR